MAQRLTVATYLQDWLLGKQSLRPSTHQAYEIHVRLYLAPHLGLVPMDELQPGTCSRCTER
jgi:hypothetical protein